MNFATLQGLTIPEGNVTQITDASGSVIWAVGDKVVLEVEKIISDTYAGETTYTDEEFILLDIYPKTNGTVSVTYGGLTKTITDTSGAEEPNAQQVFFGTFNGVSDSVATPASGMLTIEGDYRAFACGSYDLSSKNYAGIYCSCVTEITSLGDVELVADFAFFECIGLTSVTIPASVTSISFQAFCSCSSLESVVIPNGVESIGAQAFNQTLLTEVVLPASLHSMEYNPFGIAGNNIIKVSSGNEFYKIDGNCLIEIATNKLVSGFLDSVIPSYVTVIGNRAFSVQGLTDVTIPAQITSIEEFAYYHTNIKPNVIVLPTIPPVLGEYAFYGINTITVPTGCGEAYKAADGWSEYADYITEAS